MEIEILRQRAVRLIERMKAELARTGQVEPLLLLLGEHAVEQMMFDPGLLNSGRGKEALFSAARERVRQTGAQAVLMATDAYCFLPEVDRMRELKPESLEDLLSQGGIDALVAAGLGRKSEAVAVTLQTPVYTMFLEQPYERTAKGIVFGELQSLDNSSQEAKLSGRMQMFSDVQHSC